VLTDVRTEHGDHQGGDLWPRRPALTASRARPRRSRWPTTPSSGLASYFLQARDIGRINEGRHLLTEDRPPFGGMKEKRQSGPSWRVNWGLENTAIEEFLEVKYLCVGGAASTAKRSRVGPRPDVVSL